MKRNLTFVLLMCAALTFAACADEGSATSESDAPEITVKEVYDAGKNHDALLGERESVYLVYTVGGKVTQEDYYNKESFYCFYDGEYFEWDADLTNFISENAEYCFSENVYTRSFMIAPDGLRDLKEFFPLVGTTDFISTEMLEDDAALTEKDGTVTVTCTFEKEDIAQMDEDVISCEESYTFDANTREMTSVKTVHTYGDGRVSEGIVTITRDVDAPEGMNAFLKLENETENMCTLTVVSNPGADNEKTDSVRIPKGIRVAFVADMSTDKLFTAYEDAACTKLFEADTDVDSDITVYIKWDE